MRWSGFWLALLLLCACGVGSAQARTYWVRPGSSGNASGSDSSNAMTITAARAAVAAGETVRVMNGSYGSGPGVSTPGTCKNAGNADCYSCNRVVWLGNITNPELVIVPNMPVIGQSKDVNTITKGSTTISLSQASGNEHADLAVGATLQGTKLGNASASGRLFPPNTTIASKAGNYTITASAAAETSASGGTLSFSSACVTARGFTVNGGITFSQAAFRDSLGELRIIGGVTFAGADRCMLANSIINPTGQVQNAQLAFTTSGMIYESCAGDSMVGVTGQITAHTGANGGEPAFNMHNGNLGDQCAGAETFVGVAVGSPCPATSYLGESFVDSAYIGLCDLGINSYALEPATPAAEWYGCRRCKVVDTQFTMNCNQVKDWAWANRDSVTGCTFLRTTWKIMGNRPGAMMLITPGSSTIFGSQSCDGNMYQYCSWLRTGPGSIIPGDPSSLNYGTVLLNHRDDMLTETFDYCVMATDFGTAFWAADARGVGNSRINHCTMTSPSTYGVLSLTPNASWSKQLLLENNIYYRWGGQQDVNGSAVKWDPTPPAAKGSFNSNGNLYANYSGPTGTRSINNAATFTSLPSWVTSSTKDSASFYGSPMFTDSSAVALNFTGNISPAGRAHSGALDGSDIGAKQITTDNTFPAQVLDLRVLSFTSSTVTLGWTSPGDDHFPGVTHPDTAIGTPSFYTLKKWPNGINFTTWMSPTNGGSGSIWFGDQDSIVTHTPSVAGTLDSITVANLSAAQYYSFELQSHDEAGHATFSNAVIVLLNSSPTNNDGGSTPGGDPDKLPDGYNWPADAWHQDLAWLRN